MKRDDPGGVPELGPEEVGARVSAILEAAERDARAVIAEAYREQQASAPPRSGLDELAREVELLSARVDALERELVVARRNGEQPAAAPQRSADAAVQSARMRAVELALTGLSRDAIARQLSEALPPSDVERLLDDVLSG